MGNWTKNEWLSKETIRGASRLLITHSATVLKLFYTVLRYQTNLQGDIIIPFSTRDFSIRKHKGLPQFSYLSILCKTNTNSFYERLCKRINEELTTISHLLQREVNNAFVLLPIVSNSAPHYWLPYRDRVDNKKWFPYSSPVVVGHSCWWTFVA